MIHSDSKFDPALEYPFRDSMPTTDFAEAQQWNFTDGRYGVIYHLGSMPGDMKLWHNAFAITCPDGSVLATKVVGRGPTDSFGTYSVNSRTVEPYKSWSIQFDGGLRRYRPEDLWTNPGADGVHVAAKAELAISASHPVWEPGARDGDTEDSVFHTMARMHHEQAVRAGGLSKLTVKQLASKRLATETTAGDQGISASCCEASGSTARSTADGRLSPSREQSRGLNRRCGALSSRVAGLPSA